MKKVFFKYTALTGCILSLLTFLYGCQSNSNAVVTDIITEASQVYINGEQVDTVEARLGAFQGKQGDYIEFRFGEPKSFNTIFINEKTASVRQYNIYAEIDGKLTLIHTGKNIFQENIVTEPVTATAFKFEVVNTTIGDDNFTIQGISAYLIEEGA